MAYLPLGHLGHAPTLNCKKISRMEPKCAIFRQKSQKFSGEGAQPTPQTLPPLGKEIPLTSPFTLGAAALDPLQIFSQFLSLR